MLRSTLRGRIVNPDEIERRATFGRQLAREAGEIAKRYFCNPETLGVREKGHRDLVTQADLEVDRLIITRLGETFPADGVLTEESGGSAASRLWVIDPIDGTQNFAHGIAHFAISIAFHADGRTEIGVVYDPISEEMFVAVRGRGAFLNDQPLRIRDDGRAKSRLIEAGYSSVRPVEDYLQLVGALVRSGHAIVQSGSAALGLARVASARVDGYCELFLNSWDVLAGILLVEEAGGWTNDFVDSGGIESGGAVLACAPQLAGQLRNVTGIA
jgi:myo-inositol-1(or 4)-monophosphatase